MKRLQGKSNIDTIKDYVAGRRPFTQWGYTEDSVERKEGEIWTSSNGQMWIYKDGRKKALTRQTKILDACRLECKDCKKNMKLFNDRLDDKIFPKTGRCMDCQIKLEDKLKVGGKFEQYEKEKIFSNQRGYCLNLKQQLEDTIKCLSEQGNKIKFMNEDGSQEYWSDTQRERILEGAKKELEEVEKALKDIGDRLSELNGNTGNG